MDQRSDLKPEMDFRDMLRSPRKLFGYTYVYILTVLVVIGILYVNRLDAIGRSTIMPVALKDSSAFVLEIPFQSPRVLPPVDVKKAVVVNGSVLARGREIFRTTCVLPWRDRAWRWSSRTRAESAPAEFSRRLRMDEWCAYHGSLPDPAGRYRKERHGIVCLPAAGRPLRALSILRPVVPSGPSRGQ